MTESDKKLLKKGGENIFFGKFTVYNSGQERQEES